MYTVSGNTFKYREELRGAGGTWDKSRKVWTGVRIIDAGFNRNDGMMYRLQRDGCKFTRED